MAAASRISRPFHGAINVHPLGRRGPSPAPVKLQARTRDSFRSHCEKRSDRLRDEPDPELENNDPDKASPQTKLFYVSVCLLLSRQAATLQNVPPYATILCNVADDAYHKKIELGQKPLSRFLVLLEAWGQFVIS